MPVSLGCSWDSSRLMGDGFADGTDGWTRNIRSQQDEPGTGLSRKSRSIERNLGLR